MNYDKFGRANTSTNELADLLYCNPELAIENFFVVDPDQYNQAVARTYVNFPTLKKFEEVDPNLTVEEFDSTMQSTWYMPMEYKSMDIAKWLLDQCQNEAELQRIGQELLLFQERDLINLLRYLKYFVDTMRKNNVVWGLGRGSSVASFALYLIGVHKINSIYFDLDIEEFLK